MRLTFLRRAAASLILVGGLGTPAQADVPPPPVAPEVEAAADAVAAKMPYKEVLSSKLEIGRSRTSSLGSTVADHLIRYNIRKWPRGVDRDFLKQRFRELVSKELVALEPVAQRSFEDDLSYQMRYNFSLEELNASKDALQVPSVQKLLTFFWAIRLDNKNLSSGLIGSLRPRADSILNAAAADVRANVRNGWKAAATD